MCLFLFLHKYFIKYTFDILMFLETISEEDNVNNFSIENENENDDLQEQIVSSFESTGLGMTNCFRCSAHTIQLCVYDGLNNTNYKEILDKSRKVNCILF